MFPCMGVSWVMGYPVITIVSKSWSSMFLGWWMGAPLWQDGNLVSRLRSTPKNQCFFDCGCDHDGVWIMIQQMIQHHESIFSMGYFQFQPPSFSHANDWYNDYTNIIPITFIFINQCYKTTNLWIGILSSKIIHYGWLYLPSLLSWSLVVGGFLSTLKNLRSSVGGHIPYIFPKKRDWPTMKSPGKVMT